MGALLAACASSAVAPSSRQMAPYRDTIGLSGRLSVAYQKDGKGESLSGKFTWQQSGDRTDVTLASPLGQTIATIAITPTEATLTQGNGRTRAAADIDTLSAQALGWPLPVSGLRDWLQGYAMAADGGRFIASPQRTSVTTRDGWHLSYVSWQDDAATSLRPKRIDAERSASPQADQVAIRIVIDEQTQP